MVSLNEVGLNGEALGFKEGNLVGFRKVSILLSIAVAVLWSE